MKTAICLFIVCTGSSVALPENFLPDGRIENLAATDSSVQQCYIFRTVPGVRYRVESSHDLAQWTPDEEIYGLGHEFSVAMREFTPAPETGGGSSSLPASPVTNVSLLINPSSGTSGGTVVSWVSLDHGGPVTRLLSQSMSSDWERMPLFWERYGDHCFFILNHNKPSPPPTEGPQTGAKDAAMFTQLENSFATMDLAVEQSIARARNTPPPAPPDPNSRKFWRVHCDWSVDTDQDGTTDRAEFQMMADAAAGHPVHIIGDFSNKLAPSGSAFASDSNGDGIPDGEQFDTDDDGTADAFDIAASDPTATFTITPTPRYALFPIAGVEADNWGFSNRISDKGTVLFNGATWTAGLWTSLPLSSTDVQGICWARDINDQNVIVGLGDVRINSGTEAGAWARGLCYWNTPSDPPNAVVTAGRIDFAPSTEAGSEDSDLASTSPLLSNDGRTAGTLSHWTEEPQNSGYETLGSTVWSLFPDPPGPPRHGGIDNITRWFGTDGISWGITQDLKGRIIVAGTTLPDLPFCPQNVAKQPNGSILAMPYQNAAPASALVKGSWQPSPTYARAIDVSSDGSAIGSSHGGKTAPVLLNGKWTDISRYAPGAPTDWIDINTELHDTTPGGWILASRNNGTDAGALGVLLPLTVDGMDNTASPANLEDPAAGVDRISMAAIGGTGWVPEVWIMAPLGGSSNKVRFRAPLNNLSTLKLQHNQITFTPDTLSAPDQQIQVVGSGTATDDLQPVLKLGNQVNCLSVPLKIKVMKKREVKVALHKVEGLGDTGVKTVPQYMPTEEQLRIYLDRVHGRQVNTTFTVTTYVDSGPLRPPQAPSGLIRKRRESTSIWITITN